MVRYQAQVQRLLPDQFPGPFFDQTQEPWVTASRLSGQAFVDALNETIYARFPWDTTNPNMPLCSGGGSLNVSVETATETLTLFPQPLLEANLFWTPTCTTLCIGDEAFELEIAADPTQLVYYGDGFDTLMVLGTPTMSGLFLTSLTWNLTAAPGTLTECQTVFGIAPACTIQFPGQAAVPLSCANPALFATDAHVDVQGFIVQSQSQFIAAMQASGPIVAHQFTFSPTSAPTTIAPTTPTHSPVSDAPTSKSPTSQSPTSQAPTSQSPTSQAPTHQPTPQPTPFPTLQPTMFPTTFSCAHLCSPDCACYGDISTWQHCHLLRWWIDGLRLWAVHGIVHRSSRASRVKFRDSENRTHRHRQAHGTPPSPATSGLPPQASLHGPQSHVARPKSEHREEAFPTQ